MKFKPAALLLLISILMLFAFGCSQQPATETVKQNMIVSSYSKNGNTVSLTLTDASGIATLTQEYPAANVTINADNNADKARITSVSPTVDIGTQKVGYRITITANQKWIDQNTGSQSSGTANTNTGTNNNNQTGNQKNPEKQQEAKADNNNQNGNNNEKQNGENEENEKQESEND